MNPRLAAALALSKVLDGKASLSGCLPPLLVKVAPKDRALAQDLAFGSARWQPRLALLVDRLLHKPLKPSERDLEALLLVGLYQLFQTRIPPHAAVSETVACAGSLNKPYAKGLLNAVLRNAQRRGPALLEALNGDPVLRSAHPRWLQKQLKAHWPAHWEGICAANNAHPPLCLRVNRARVSPQAYLETLIAAGIQATACTWAPEGIRLLNPCPVEELPGFAEGWVSVQDEAAQLAAGLLELAPGQRVLDACAAPGGKTCHLLEIQPQLSAVLALDLEAARLQRIEENLQRLGLQAQLLAADARDTDAWWDGTPFQRILLDAPCSATGVIRRHPDIKLTRQPDDIPRLAQLQGELLDRLWPTLETGGLLLYATCSVLPEENSQVVQDFLQRTPGAKELGIAATYGLPQACGRQLLPQEQGHDGFYYAKLIKLP